MPSSGRSSSKPWDRWNQVADLVRLAAASSRVANIETPINVILVGKPGDGKTRMVMRVDHLAHVQTLSDTTYLGLCQCLNQVRDGIIGTLVIPDLGTIVGRRGDVATQCIATLAMMTAEGVRAIRVGKRVKDYGGARASLITAVTFGDLAKSYQTLNQNAFLSRVILVNFDISLEEMTAMMVKKHQGDERLLRSLSFRSAGIRRDGTLPIRPVIMADTFAKQARSWWLQLYRRRSDRFFGFRSGDFLTGLLQSAAYLRGDGRVRSVDVKFVRERILPLIMRQVQMHRPEEES